MKNKKDIKETISRIQKYNAIKVIGYVIMVLIPVIIAYYSFFNQHPNLENAYKKGMALLRLKEYSLAAEQFLIIYNEDINYPDIAYQYGYSLYKQDKFNDALIVWQNVLSDKDYDYLNYYKGFCYIYTNHKKDAISAFNKAYFNLRKKNDSRCWNANYNYLILKYKDFPSDSLAKIVEGLILFHNNFEKNILGDIVVKDLSEVERYYNSGIIDLLEQERMINKLLYNLAYKQNFEKRFISSINSILQSWQYCSSPFIGYIAVSESDLIKQLDLFTSSMNYFKNPRVVFLIQ